MRPRQLVSEEGGIVNLAVDDGFGEQSRNPRQKMKHRIGKRNNRGAVTDIDHSSAILSPDTRYLSTAGTGTAVASGGNQLTAVEEGKSTQKGHARFLVELMSPFASRAGTQGITSSSNKNFSS